MPRKRRPISPFEARMLLVEALHVGGHTIHSARNIKQAQTDGAKIAKALISAYSTLIDLERKLEEVTAELLLAQDTEAENRTRTPENTGD